MREGYTHITVLLDKSGSMASILKDTLGGFNTFLKGQKETAKEGDTFSLIQFSTDYITTFKNARIKDVHDLTEAVYKPMGGTALLDAAVRTIKEQGEFFASIKESDRPSKVIFLMITDGEENASKNATKAQLKTLIQEHTNVWKWEFVFIGANQDAIQEAAHYGIAAASAMSFGASKEGVTATFSNLTRSLNTYKEAPVGLNYASSGAAFTAEERLTSMGGIQTGTVTETPQVNPPVSVGGWTGQVDLTILGQQPAIGTANVSTKTSDVLRNGTK